MNDRELLELAAKAAKIPYTKPTEDYDGSLGLAVGSNPMRTMTWNPLTDDGDALRLAVKLGIDLTLHGAVFTHPYIHSEISPTYAINGDNFFEEDATDNDPYAATRRAIVRAAAEIGRSMK